MKRKKKICVECGKECYLFSKNRCKSCATVEYAATTKRNRVSKKIKNRASKKKHTITSLKKKLWRVFSKYVRLRDSDKDGYCACISCGKKGFWTKDNMEAGHFRSRRYNSTFIDEKNVHAQCTSCNGYNQGETYLYGKALDKKYGSGTADAMVDKSREVKKWTTFELEQLCKIYTEKFNELLVKKKL